VLPDGCIDIVWTDDSLIVAGPDTAAVPLAWRPDARFAGIRFRPGLGPAVLGVPASAVLDARVDLGDVMGARARCLEDQLRRAPSLQAAAGALAGAVRGWLPAAAPADRLVEAAVATLRASDGPRPVASLAGELGVSERQLNRRFVAAVGYGPKLLHRILRLRRFLRLAAGGPERHNLAALAHEAGYADHAHLVRDCQELAGLPPARLVGRPLTEA
jgi:methylphosphotriester-DNA--protein-cysteine methyltransferase